MGNVNLKYFAYRESFIINEKQQFDKNAMI